MSVKEKRTFEEEKKNGMKVTDNMDGEKNANKKLEVADVSDKMTIPQVREYIRRYRTGEDVNKYLRQFKLLQPELNELQKLADKRTS
tara:strand:- start:8 stop:268 length:261 start_codon:yes stop_codon:yes gene_type:complete